MSKEHPDIDHSAYHALTRFHNRTSWEPVTYDAPFDEVLATAEDGEDGVHGEYEIRQRMLGVRIFFAWLTSEGAHPAAMLKQLVAAGRAIHAEPFTEMTMDECGELMGEGKASHSIRCKALSKEIRKNGFKGDKLPGQKSREASLSYSVSSTGNCNRLGGEKFRKRKQRIASRMSQGQGAAFPKTDQKLNIANE